MTIPPHLWNEVRAYIYVFIVIHASAREGKDPCIAFAPATLP